MGKEQIFVALLYQDLLLTVLDDVAVEGVDLSMLLDQGLDVGVGGVF